MTKRLGFILIFIFSCTLFACSKQSTAADNLGAVELPSGLTGTLAYARHKKHKNWGIVLVDLETGKKKLVPNEIYKDFDWIGGLSLSNDLKTIICHIKENGKYKTISKIDVDTGKVTKLPDMGSAALYPRLSPDEKYIAFYIAPKNNKKNIVIVDYNGGNKKILACPDNNCLHPTWLNSDNQSLVYIQYSEYNTPEKEYIAVSIAGKTKIIYKNLSKSGYHLHMPRIISNTNKVSYLQTKNGTFFNESNIYLIDKKENKRLIFHSEKKISSYDWLGSSDYVALTEVNELSPSIGIFVANTNTKKKIKISDDAYFALGPVWSQNSIK